MKQEPGIPNQEEMQEKVQTAKEVAQENPEDAARFVGSGGSDVEAGAKLAMKYKEKEDEKEQGKSAGASQGQEIPRDEATQKPAGSGTSADAQQGFAQAQSKHKAAEAEKSQDKSASYSSQRPTLSQ